MSDTTPPRDTSDDATGSMSLLLQNWSGNENEIMQRVQSDYFPQLRGLSQRVLGNYSGAAWEAEDVVQSAMKSFCLYMRRQDAGNSKDRDDVWRLLCHIAARKARRRRQRQTRGLRGGRVVPLTDLAGDDGNSPIDQLLRELSPHEFDLILRDAIEQLDDSLQPIALMVMEGKTQEEISQVLNCSRRTVIRKFDLVKRLLGVLLA